MTRPHSTLDDIAHVAGYTAARRIAAWLPARRIYIPTSARPGHPFELLIGRMAFTRLVRAYAGQFLSVPTQVEDQRDAREKAIAVALSDGASTADVAAAHGITERRARQIKAALTDSGLLDFARLEPDDQI